jgi:hypothetical protein
MSRHRCQVISFAAVVAMLFASAAVAQSSMELVGNIPFSFHVGQSTLPAGAYIVKSCTTTSGSPYIAIRSRSDANVIMQLTLPTAVGNQNRKPRLVFNGYGSNFFLSKILSPSDGIGAILIRGKLERELAAGIRGKPEKELAAGKALTTEVALDAR